jgi:hypothetical protein
MSRRQLDLAGHGLPAPARTPPWSPLSECLPLGQVAAASRSPVLHARPGRAGTGIAGEWDAPLEPARLALCSSRPQTPMSERMRASRHGDARGQRTGGGPYPTAWPGGATIDPEGICGPARRQCRWEQGTGGGARERDAVSRGYKRH